jgi:aspartate/tyrosine/aromatic aminotransferase
MCERANAAVYVEEQRLEEVRNWIGRGAAELRPMEFISASTSGLIVCGYQFSDREPSELAALFTRAIAELKEASPDLALLHAQCHAPQKLK